MIYDEIIATSLAYSNRTDNVVVNNMDNFLKVVEARLNQYILTKDMVQTAYTDIIENTYFYTLPTDFLQLKSVFIRDVNNPNDALALEYVPPESITALIANSEGTNEFSIVGNTIQLASIPDSDSTVSPAIIYTLELNYYGRLSPLNNDSLSNWISESNPNIYIFGLLVEISSFVKDVQTTQLWEQRFKQELDQLNIRDDSYYWRGPTLVTRCE